MKMNAPGRLPGAGSTNVLCEWNVVGVRAHARIALHVYGPRMLAATA